MTHRKGIILAGGAGTRLHPITKVISKQLLPIYDKPMIYYPLTVLMHCNIKDILIITTPCDQPLFKKLLENGSQWGIKIEYETQAKPEGIAQAFILAKDFLNGSPSTLILGDNIFFGHGLSDLLLNDSNKRVGAQIYGYHVSNPEQYGVVDFNTNGTIKSIIEKPINPPSNYAVTGLYFLDNSASDRAKNILPSARGELEITTLLNTYLEDNLLKVTKMESGIAWLDTGTHSSLLEASNFVRTLTERQGLKIGSPDQIASELSWV